MNGACTIVSNGFICTCPFGYTGSLCEKVIDNCQSNPCNNNGTCRNFIGGYVCFIMKIYKFILVDLI